MPIIRTHVLNVNSTFILAQSAFIDRISQLMAWLIVFLSGHVKITRINKTLKQRNQSQNKS
ncbi:hypothetical protein [Lentilactobacillus buchneri]|uniref:hypothetical protein n=1 Tax=Lentilactobacillus buchneri TaxID=1581 RepID=UPI0034E3CA08